jgi:hypothetical protein
MDIQLFVVGLIFLLALFFIARNIYLKATGRRKAGCENCGISGEVMKDKAVNTNK